jgi:hypothetical protein
MKVLSETSVYLFRDPSQPMAAPEERDRKRGFVHAVAWFSNHVYE